MVKGRAQQNKVIVVRWNDNSVVTLASNLLILLVLLISIVINNIK